MSTNAWKNITIGSRTLSGNVALAPMSGTSDMTFRALCHEQGASLGCTELVSARGIRYNPSLSRSFRYLEINPENEGPVAIQLFGYEVKDFAEAIPLVLEHPLLGKTSFIDINMGCPVAKVIKTGAGSALMSDLPLAASILEASVRAASPYSVPVTVKFRKGWDETSSNAVEFAQMCRDFGAAAVTIHGRTREQMYQGTADWACIALVAQTLAGSGIPVFGNGDVKDGESAVRMLAQTGVDGVMIGRAAQGNPWIFAEAKAALLGEPAPPIPTALQRADMIRRHLTGLCSRLGESLAVREMRAQLACYFRGQRHASAYKVQAMQAVTYDEVDAILHEWVAVSLLENSGEDNHKRRSCEGLISESPPEDL